MYERLIAFGDSWTSGRGIAEPLDADTPNLAWPSVVANQLDVEYINLGKGGASPKRVWKKIIDFQNYRNTDLVIILWPYSIRSCIFSNDGKIKDIRPNNNKKYNNLYYKYIFEETDNIIDFSLRVDHIGYFLSTKVKTLLNFSITDNVMHFSNQKILQTMEDIPEIYGSNDNNHPNQQGHSEIAQRMVKFI